MRIAQVAPLWERVPPPAYGGIELVVSHLTDELVRRGHDVTLFASGDSRTLANLKSVYPQALRQNSRVREYTAYELLELSQVYDQAQSFDIIHSHVGYTALPFAQVAKTPTLHTLHIITPDGRPLYTRHARESYISISNAQRSPDPDLNYIRTVYNGIDTEAYSFVPRPESPPYLAFLGRLSPAKGPHHAIAIARQTGWRLKLAGKIDPVDQDFFEQQVAPHLDGEQIEYLGEADHATKVQLLGQATALLFPITWHEPFGLVMTEAMATGTPVIAMGLGSVPEVVVQGKTGFICRSIQEMATYVPTAALLNRQACRDHVVKNFGIKQMVDGYEAAYHQLLQGRASLNGHARMAIA